MREMLTIGLLCLCILLFNGCQSEEQEGLVNTAASNSIPEKVDFNFHVKPILSDRCFACHGPDDGAREAGLRLDNREGAFAALGEHQDHYAIVAGNVENSSLIERIHTDDPELLMPPPESNLTLEQHEKATDMIGVCV